MDAMACMADEIAGDARYPSARHRTALYLALECWGRELDEQPDWGRASLASRIRDQWRQELSDDGYGIVMISFLLITVLAAAISWAVQRLLDWLYPNNVASAANMDRLGACKSQRN